MNGREFRRTILGTPNGDLSTDWVLTSDEVLATTIDGEPLLILNVQHKDFVRMADGQLGPSVAYMQGLLKTTGDTGLLIDLLAKTDNDANCRAWIETATE